MGKVAWQIIGVGGTALAAMATRKALTVVWEKSTKRSVPMNPNDDEIGLGEALAWTIVSGVGVAVVRLTIQRYAAKNIRSRFGDEALPKNMQKKTSKLEA
ncbi:DUF4235 domain-containing protein [Brevibacterium senegalense]|uniref:DUF4235 domain-containing protein n=1 Tax=Brevibacterium senegalense TaxID=1033736 RepID=UPI00030A57AD|nr:DUF4235 domain-containing protein [Brevibacterium senegalense]